jgi:flagellar biogenesis protein FliO
VNWWLEIAPGLTVLLLLGTLLFVLRRKGTTAIPRLRWNRRGLQNRTLCLLERQSLSPQHTLHLIQVGRTRLLIGCAPSSCHLLAALPETDEQGGLSLPGENPR